MSLRSGEIRGLRVCDVDLEANVLRVRQAISRNVVDTPKSGHDREIPLTRALHGAAHARRRAAGLSEIVRALVTFSELRVRNL
jgi:integrase